MKNHINKGMKGIGMIRWTLFILTVFIFSSVSVSAIEGDEDGLISWYNFTDNANDFSTNGNDASNNGVVFNGQYGIWNGSGAFVNTPIYDINDEDWSLHFEIKGNQSVEGERGIIFGDNKKGGNSSIFIYLKSDGRLRINQGIDDNTGITTTSLDNDWYNISITKGSRVIVYVNGNAEANFSSGNSLRSDDNEFDIGYDEANINSFLNAYMRNFQIWEKELSSEQVQDLNECDRLDCEPPQIFIENIIINNAVLNNGTVYDENDLNISLALGVNNTDTDINTSYILDGITTTICDTGTTAPSCTLSRLSNGNYTIRFRAENGDTTATTGTYDFTIDKDLSEDGSSTQNLIKFTTPNATQPTVSNPVTFQTLLNLEGARCDLYIDFEKAKTFEDIVSFSHDRVIDEYGRHQYQVYCLLENQTTDISYYDTTGLIDFNITKPEKQVSFRLYDEQQNLVDDVGNLYVTTPCPNEVVLLGSDNNLQTDEIYFSRVDNGYATFTLPYRENYEMCLVRGNLYFNESDFTSNYDIEQSEAVTEIGNVRVNNETSSFDIIINRQRDLNEPTSPGYWGVSMLEMLSTLFLILFGIILIYIGIHDNKEGSYKVTLLGGLLILFGMGYNINLIVGALI